MSKYYHLKELDLKVRVSDHEPNTSLRGSSDIYLYVKSADGRVLSIESQIERICDRRDLDIEEFKEILDDWKDGTYDENVFVSKKEEEEEEEMSEEALASYKRSRDYFHNIMDKINKENEAKIAGYYIDPTIHGAELRKIVKQISLETGVSQGKIKSYFGLLRRWD